MTFDVPNAVHVAIYYGWQKEYELFSICRNCHKPTIFVVEQRKIDDRELFRDDKRFMQIDASINPWLDVVRYVGLRENIAHQPPEHLPKDVHDCYIEGATCLSVECYNAAGTMFRTCVDLSTRPMLPEEEVEGLNRRTRRDLGLRLHWLFDNGKLPNDLRELSKCIREDGNDGAHTATLTKEDSEDLLDFTEALLERLFTEPKRLQLAEERRHARRGKSGGNEVES